MANQCPHCLARLDQPNSIRASIRGFGTYRLTPGGQLKAGEAIVTQQGSYRCTACGWRLNKFLKRVAVGVIGGEEDAAASGSTDA